MHNRIPYQKLVPASFTALLAFDSSVKDTSIEKLTRHLIKIRVSQLNGCLFCLDMHSKEAKIAGEKELRLYHLPVWHESELFTPRERAALEWAELLTKFSPHGVSDDDFVRVSAHYSEKEIADLTVMICAINAWNRFGVAFLPSAGGLDKVMGLDKAGLSA